MKAVERTESLTPAQLTFALLGVGAGAVLPSLVIGISVIASDNGDFLVGPKLWIGAKWWCVIGMGLCVLGGSLAAVGLSGVPLGWWRSESRLTNILMVLAGAACVFSLEAYVISTGGPVLSVFSFYYLYIPVVVGITFPRLHTVCTGAVCWAFCIFALWLTWDTITWRSSAKLMGTTPHNMVYAFLFSVQMCITIFMIYLNQGNQEVIPAESRPVNERLNVGDETGLHGAGAK